MKRYLMTLILVSMTAFAQNSEEVEVSAELLDAYAGSYQLAPNMVFAVRHDSGKLMVQLTGQPEFRVFALSQTRFKYKVVPAELEFARDENGTVTHLTLHQNGMAQKAKRLEKAPEPPAAVILSDADAKKLVGNWMGTIEGMGLRLAFEIEVDEQNAMDVALRSPDQGNISFKPTRFDFADNTFSFEHSTIAASYKGVYNAEGPKIEGTFNQRGADFTLNLEKLDEGEKIEAPKRPQEPQKPYPYHEEEVSYPVAAGHTLAGTLTMPKEGGPFAAVILISGSGPQDRNEELLGHKPFLVWSDHLTRKGLAVLRFDDRGTAKSTGDHATATTADFADDVEAGIAYLKTRREIDPERIGLVGHSEGGVIGPLVASRNGDVAFVVMMAGTGVNGAEILTYQSDLMNRVSGMDETMNRTNNKIIAQAIKIVTSEPDSTKAEAQIKAMFEKEKSEMPEALIKEMGLDNPKQIEASINFFNTAWSRFFFEYDPAETLKKVTCPVLALFGSKDLQVAPDQNLEPVKKALAHNKSAVVTNLEGLNHLFQTADKGTADEYSQIEETIAPIALEAMSNWILETIEQ